MEYFVHGASPTAAKHNIREVEHMKNILFLVLLVLPIHNLAWGDSFHLIARGCNV